MEYFNINNRRYLGNKYKLLDWIKLIVNEQCGDIESLFDVFSGTGSVASAFTDKRLVVNDMMYSNYMAALCWFSSQKIDIRDLRIHYEVFADNAAPNIKDIMLSEIARYEETEYYRHDPLNPCIGIR